MNQSVNFINKISFAADCWKTQYSELEKYYVGDHNLIPDLTSSFFI